MSMKQTIRVLGYLLTGWLLLWLAQSLGVPYWQLLGGLLLAYLVMLILILALWIVAYHLRIR